MPNSTELTARPAPPRSESLTGGSGPRPDPGGRLLVAALAVLIGAGLLACRDAAGALDPDGARVAATLEISPDSTAGWTGDTVQLSATVTGPDGGEMDREPEWASLAGGVASVDADGTVTGVSAGTARIEAHRGSARDTATVVVAANTAVSDTAATSDTTAAADTTASDSSTAPPMPAPVSVAEDARTDSTVRYVARWTASDDADSYAWEAGSDGGVWSDAASGVTALRDSFTAPRGSVDDASYFCTRAVNTAGESASACTGFTVPAAAADTAISGSSGAEPFVMEDFSTYSSTSDMLSDPRDIYAPNYDSYDTENITLVDEGVDVDGHSLEQSMRYTFPNNGGACGDQSISRSLNMPADTYVVWVEWYVRFDTDFTTDAGNSNCAPAYKLLFGLQNSGRFDIATGLWDRDYKVAWPSGNVDNVGGDAAAAYDGRWHRFRIEFRHESSAGADDGAIRFWVDDTRIVEKTGLDTDRASGPMRWVKLGANINQGPDFDGMGLNWGRVAVWTSDPGW